MIGITATKRAFLCQISLSSLALAFSFFSCFYYYFGLIIFHVIYFDYVPLPQPQVLLDLPRLLLYSFSPSLSLSLSFQKVKKTKTKITHKKMEIKTYQNKVT